MKNKDIKLNTLLRDGNNIDIHKSFNNSGILRSAKNNNKDLNSTIENNINIEAENLVQNDFIDHKGFLYKKSNKNSKK